MALRNGFLLNGVAFDFGLGVPYSLLAGLLPGATVKARDWAALRISVGGMVANRAVGIEDRLAGFVGSGVCASLATGHRLFPRGGFPCALTRQGNHQGRQKRTEQSVAAK